MDQGELELLLNLYNSEDIITKVNEVTGNALYGRFLSAVKMIGPCSVEYDKSHINIFLHNGDGHFTIDVENIFDIFTIRAQYHRGDALMASHTEKVKETELSEWLTSVKSKSGKRFMAFLAEHIQVSPVFMGKPFPGILSAIRKKTDNDLNEIASLFGFDCPGIVSKGTAFFKKVDGEEWKRTVRSKVVGLSYEFRAYVGNTILHFDFYAPMNSNARALFVKFLKDVETVRR